MVDNSLYIKMCGVLREWEFERQEPERREVKSFLLARHEIQHIVRPILKYEKFKFCDKKVEDLKRSKYYNKLLNTLSSLFIWLIISFLDGFQY